MKTKTTDQRYLKCCNIIFNALLRCCNRLYAKEKYEDVLRLTNLTAQFATLNHPGVYADGRIENILLKIGRKMGSQINTLSIIEERPKSDDALSGNKIGRVLHVFTEVYQIGGHTRLAYNWIRKDPDHVHSVIILNQNKKIEVPKELKKIVNNQNGTLIMVPPHESYLNKAKLLRAFSKDYNYVVLHHHPNDPIPLVAFAVSGTPPIAILNHADHLFGLGSSITDVMLNCRESAMLMSKERRFIDSNRLLPLPLCVSVPAITKSEARQELGIPASQCMILSMGSGYKYTPNQKYNFFKTCQHLLALGPDVHIYIVGVDQAKYEQLTDIPCDTRLHLLGYLTQPQMYQTAADIYLDPFPFGSATALLESILLGSAPVLAYAPDSGVMASEDVALVGVIDYSSDEQDYVARVQRMIRSHQLRFEMNSQAREMILRHHDLMWREYLKPIDNFLNQTQHHPRNIPKADFLVSNDDLALSRFHRCVARKNFLLILLDSIWQYITFPEMIVFLIFSLKEGLTTCKVEDMKKWFGLLRRCFNASYCNRFSEAKGGQ